MSISELGTVVHITVQTEDIELLCIKDEHISQIVLVPVGDCCSYSTFLNPRDVDLGESESDTDSKYELISQLLGHTLVSIESGEVTIGREGSGYVDENTEYLIKTNGGPTVRFVLQNTSNGYYSGWVEKIIDTHTWASKRHPLQLLRDTLIELLIFLPNELAELCGDFIFFYRN